MKPEMIWPHGKQSAAMLCVMLDAEFIWLAMDEKKYDTPKHRSMGEYGPKRGVDRILSLLEEFGVKATFFAPGLSQKYIRRCSSGFPMQVTRSHCTGTATRTSLSCL